MKQKKEVEERERLLRDGVDDDAAAEAKDGGDGDFYCVNGGTIGGTTGSCTCTSCDTAYGGASCHIGPCDMEQSCYDFNVRNGMTTPATCAWMADVTGCTV